MVDGRRQTPAKPAKPAKPKKKPGPKKSTAPGGGPWGEVFAPRKAGERRYWLIKSEPDVFSWSDLLKARKQTTCWDGVRNFAARNFLRDGMKLGDRLFWYHSNADPQAIVGVCEVVREAYPDHTQFEPSNKYFDPDSDPKAPTWVMVDVAAVASFKTPVTLKAIKQDPSLKDMVLLRIGRLSVTPVTAKEWAHLCALGGVAD